GNSGGKVRPRNEAEPAEHLRFVALQVVVGEGEADTDLHIAGCKLRQAVLLVTETCSQLGDAPAGAGGELRRGNTYGQGQVPTQPYSLCRFFALGTHPIVSSNPAQEFEGFRWGQHIEVEQVRTFSRDQSGQPVPAGDHY